MTTEDDRPEPADNDIRDDQNRDRSARTPVGRLVAAGVGGVLLALVVVGACTAIVGGSDDPAPAVTDPNTTTITTPASAVSGPPGGSAGTPNVPGLPGTVGTTGPAGPTGGEPIPYGTR